MSKQRSSSRQIKLSKAFKVVDEETKRLAREQHLLLLERDNYNETEVFGLGNEEDDEYIDVQFFYSAFIEYLILIFSFLG